MKLAFQAVTFFTVALVNIITLFTTPILLIAIIFGLHWKYALISAGVWLFTRIIYEAMYPSK